jgi:hypothetical protein
VGYFLKTAVQTSDICTYCTYATKNYAYLLSSEHIKEHINNIEDKKDLSLPHWKSSLLMDSAGFMPFAGPLPTSAVFFERKLLRIFA